MFSFAFIANSIPVVVSTTAQYQACLKSTNIVVGTKSLSFAVILMTNFPFAYRVAKSLW